MAWVQTHSSSRQESKGTSLRGRSNLEGFPTEAMVDGGTETRKELFT